MTVFEQAKRYLTAIPPAISGQGGHAQTLSAARALKWGFNLSDSEAMGLLQDWNLTCLPPWTQKELEHKLREADTKDFGKPRGYLLTGRPNRDTRPTPQSGEPKPDLPSGEYDLSDSSVTQLPEALPDGFEKVLRSCFQPGEGVRVMSGLTEDGLVGCDSKGGLVLSREEWLKKLEEAGDINGLYYRLGGPAVGVYLGVNPMKEDGRGRDSDVLHHRHCLLEFDKISLEEQWLLYTRSNLPCAAIIYSGNKSLHAWVKIDAKDRKEYDERVNLVYNHFAPYKPDPKNKNPGRFSRCPDAKRGDGYQLLMAVDIGAANFMEWSRHLLVQGIGTTYDQNTIIAYEPDADGLTVAGHRWLRKGGSCILCGPSGVGKSSLGRQCAISWALGRPWMGVKPSRPLKILMVQAENDMADLHDMDIGIYQGLGLLEDKAAMAQVHKNLITNHNVADTGFDFIKALQKLVDHHQPDLVIIDPLLSFIGNDISKQEVVGQFCRNWLNPILAGSNVAILAIHHTGKPPKEIVPNKKGQRPARSMAESAYQMLGSSELTNWARAVMVLQQLPDRTYELTFAKRGARARATHPDGTRTDTIYLRHSSENIYWIQTNPPEECATGNDDVLPQEAKEDKMTIPMKVAKANAHDFLAKCPVEGERHGEICERLAEFAANQLGIDIQGGSLKRTLGLLIKNKKLQKKGQLYVKGPNA
jgi:RecA-family ATPase